MNTQNLKQGDRVPNYRALCDLLGEPVKNGESKASQLKEFQRYFRFSREGNAYIIEEIYSQALEKVDKRSEGARSIYVEDLSVQLLHHLAKQKQGDVPRTIFCKADEMFEKLGMVNHRYIPTKKAIKQFLEENPGAIEKFDVDEFYVRTGSRLRDILHTTLNNLQRRYIIRYEVRHQIKSNGTWRSATEKEEIEIMKAKRDAIEQMGVETEKIKGERAVYLMRRSFEFYDLVDRLLEERFGWEKIYRGYQISFHGANIEQLAQTYERQVKEIRARKLSLNGKVHDAMNRDAEERYRANQERIDQLAEQVYGEISEMQKNERFRFGKDYVERQLFLDDKLIKIEQKKK